MRLGVSIIKNFLYLILTVLYVISPIDIIYSSLDQEVRQSVLLMRQFLTSDRTIYTAAIEMLEDIQKYGEKD